MKKSSHGLKRNSRGFALIATILLMVLLAIITVGTLSLSVVTLRSGIHDSAQARARANARMALMIAIGELQKQIGPDQRITANGEILDNPETSQNESRHRHWTGVWDSWIAGDPATAPVTTNYPSGTSHHQTIGNQPDASMRPDYANKDRHFRAWLVSLNPDESTDPDASLNLDLTGETLPQADSEAIQLVGKGSLGESADVANYVNARLMQINTANNLNRSGRGRYAWWVGDESQKARMLHDSYLSTRPTNAAQKLFRNQAPASMGTKLVTGLENITPDQDAKLEVIPSLNSVDLLPTDQNAKPSQNHFHEITTHSHAVLGDVREGGMKRDLSTILERTINPSEVYNLEGVAGTEAQFRRASSLTDEGNSFMLYNFDNMVTSQTGRPTGEALVPIQDLAAYYQLYDHSRPGWKGGVQFTTQQSSPSNNLLTSGVMTSNPDYGRTASDYENYLRQHSAIYRSVYPVKIEFILSYLTEVRTQAEIDADIAAGIAEPDTHKLRIGYTPAMTFWNPNNIPVVMNFGNPNQASIMIRETPVPLAFDFRKHATFGGPVTRTTSVEMNKVTNTQQGELYTLYISGREPLVFQPGESKVLALQSSSNTNPAIGLDEIDFMNRGAGINENFFPEHELIPGWNPERFIRPAISRFIRGSRGNEDMFTFKATDYISSVVRIGANRDFTMDFTQKSRHGRNAPGVMWHYRTFELKTRMFPGGFPNFMVFTPYRTAFLSAGLNPTGSNIVNTAFTNIVNPPRSAQILIESMQNPANTRDDLPQAFFYYGMKAATEVHESNHSFPASGAGAGRRFPSRPFTHATAMKPEFLDTISGSSAYNYGWNWYFQPLNNSLDAPISISAQNHGYYGGGYTAENGVTHIVQQELPLTPPISIAALSHAHLGGFSLSSEAAAAGYNGLQNNNMYAMESFRRTTVLGFGGLAPRTLQAIGNSYAHPNIPSDKAITTWRRTFFQNNANPNNTTINEPFADHSYLANKALWDEYFFSSITPVPANNPLFAPEQEKSVEEVARYFLFENEPLPNRRMVPYNKNMDDESLTDLLADYDLYLGGFADKIAANMMIAGPFNINSTSETAWRIFFSSLKGKSVTYLQPQRSVSGGINIEEQTPNGVPVSSGSIANGESYSGSSTDPSDAEQWKAWRELTDEEINTLARAMVKQVKKRGPFLSLSEFVNRRLDRNNIELSTKGALQAAIDDPDCPINEGFRDPSRQFSARESSYVSAVFPEAMEGPIAYGSSAYVDQADILRNFAEQLTPRGDTFVIRTYGDSLDPDGKVQARAWCEAVIQRLPEYIDHKSSNDTSGSGDSPETKQIELTSEANRSFGRKLQIISFRWLNPSEI